MNFYVNKKLYKITRFDLKSYKKQLFERHLRFFFDFCQICSLFYTNRLNSNIFIYNLSYLHLFIIINLLFEYFLLFSLF